METQAYQVPLRAQKIILALGQALITEPDDLVIHDKDGQMIERCRALLAEFPKLYRLGFILGLYIFDRIPFLFGFGLRRFVNLGIEAQKRYAQRWQTTRNHYLLEFFKSLNGMVMVVYFSHHDVWNYIGYHPKAHVQERIALRDEVLRREKMGETRIEEMPTKAVVGENLLDKSPQDWTSGD